ncbi:hypothetical protein ACEWY4_002104 [Coilia grayii]|uniref:Ig-like domain-containing protein n=1 Tax=Coilia grayii TaxID=363190 RepID=A0ABD1KVB2_9TELE
MTIDGDTHYSDQYDITFRTYVPSKVISCEATNRATGQTASKRKIVQVAEGPSNVTLKAPKMLLNGVESTFECFTTCRPSCNYIWKDSNQQWTSNSSVFTYKTPPYINQVTLSCIAQNSLSQLYAVASATVQVAQGPEGVVIQGPSSVRVGDSETYYCLYTGQPCSPSCVYTWHYRGKVYTGDAVTVPILQQGKAASANKLVIHVDQFHKTEQLECTAMNTLSGETKNVTKILQVTDPIAVRPLTPTPPILGSSYALECVGATQSSHIQWTKDGKPLSMSDRVHLSDNDDTLSFDSLRQSDAGVYDCTATEQGKVIPGVSYELKVLYGPLNPKITVWYQSGNRPAGPTTLLLPGSPATFSCSAQCSPACGYVWFLNDNIVSKNATFTISSPSTTDEGVLTCVPYTIWNHTAIATNIELIGGPKDVTISGPKSVQVGQKSTFQCSAVCTPPCVYSWQAYGITLHGSKVELTISHYVATETLTCIAQNSITGKIVAANTTIDVTGNIFVYESM